MSIKAVIKNKKMKKPHVGSLGAAGADLRVPYDIQLKPGEIHKVHTGVAVKIPEGCVGLIFPRSSLGKIKVGMANTVGVIDSDYTGELIVLLENKGHTTQLFYKDDRIVQLVVVPCVAPKFEYVDSLEETERGDKGFGSTGKE